MLGKEMFLSPNLFKIFINDLPNIFKHCPDAVNLNGHIIECLMYADDTVIFSNTKSGLQKKLDKHKALCNLNTAFKDFLYISSFPCLKIPLDVNFILKYL
jgi:hypothetical protein